jgi:hypothetical protein
VRGTAQRASLAAAQAWLSVWLVSGTGPSRRADREHDETQGEEFYRRRRLNLAMCALP